MRVKLDENLPASLAEVFLAAGHDVSTVVAQRLSGKPDRVVLRKAASEGRVFVTLDRDFGDVRAYPPGTHAGIVVFRSRDQRWHSLRAPARRLLDSGALNRLGSGLAIVDAVRVRIHRGPRGVGPVTSDP